MSKDNSIEKRRQTIELLYWIWYCIGESPGRSIDYPSDLWAANRQFYKNWRGKSGKVFPQHLHLDIPDILDELMASGMVADYPENMPDSPLAGRFEQMKSRNGDRISLYPPIGFQVYITAYGWAHLEYAIQKGELGKALSQHGAVVDWERIASAELSKELTATKVDNQSANSRAKELGITTKRLLRWDRILNVYLPLGLTQFEIAEKEERDVETIRDDYADMRKKGLFPSNPPPTPP